MPFKCKVESFNVGHSVGQVRWTTTSWFLHCRSHHKMV